MRLALISDVHGNDVAFAAVVVDAERLAVDGFVCLGDVAQGGPQPREALERLRALGCPAVMGNSDAFLLEIPADSPEPVTEQQLEIREWTLSKLDADHLAFLRSFAPTVQLATERILAFHGSPRSYDDVLLPGAEPAALEPFHAAGAELLAGGHTHLQWSRIVDGALYVNPGSVGVTYDRHQPEDDFKLTPAAEYAVVTSGTDDASVEFRCVAYSLDELTRVARASGRPFVDEYVESWRPFGDAATPAAT